MKNTLTIVIVIVVLAGILIVFLGKERAKVEEDVETETETETEGEPIVDGQENQHPSITISEETDKYLIDVKYPEVSNEDVQLILKDYANSKVEEFKKNFEENDPDGKEMPLIEGRKYTLSVRFEPKESELYTTYLFYITIDSLGAHPNSVAESLTFNKEGELVDIEDVLGEYIPEGGNFRAILSQKVRDQIYYQLGNQAEYGWIENGTGPDLKNFNTFFTSNEESITFVYSPYVIGPYAWGFIEVELPFGAFTPVNGQ